MRATWFVALDVVRRKAVLRGRLRTLAYEAVHCAGSSTGLFVLDARVLPAGIRVLVRAESKTELRAFVKRFVACFSSINAFAQPHWRARAHVLRIQPHKLAAYRDFLRRCGAFGEELMPKSPARPVNSQMRALAAILRVAERCNESRCGGDAMAARARRYVAEHDAPQDDRSAFARLCFVIFAAGLGFGPVESCRDALETAFSGFEPSRVAEIDDAQAAAILAMPIIRNRAKIDACVENGRRWHALCADGQSYLARVAAAAAGDHPSDGWPRLTAMLRADFSRLGDMTARLTLKRWGFFMALSHPAVRRLLTRLHCVEAGAPDMHVQRLVASLAQKAGRDPYAVEAALADFASDGPCRKEPRCAQCPLCDRCPTGIAREHKSATDEAAAAPSESLQTAHSA